MRAARILLAREDPAFGRTLSLILTEHDYHVGVVALHDDLLTTLAHEPWDLVILEAGRGPDGLEVLARLKADGRHSDLPVLLLAALPAPEGSEQALTLGASDFLAPPFAPREVIARVKARLRAGRELAQARAEARSRSELVEILREIAGSLTPEEIYRILVRRMAEGLGVSRCSVLLRDPDPGTATVVAAFENPLLGTVQADLARYPEIQRAFDTGDTVLSDAVESDSLFPEAREQWHRGGHQVETTSAVVIPFSVRDRRAGVFYLRTRGADVTLSPLDLRFADQVIAAAVPALEKAYALQEVVEGQRQLRELADSDPLTGLANRRALQARLDRELEQARRYGTVLSCLMLDVDDFKVINDAHGHQMGDRVLAQLAALFRREQRAIDVVARFGGEEFCLLLPFTGAAGARLLAERILRRVAGHRFGEPQHPISVTVSIGIATYPEERVSDGLSLLRLADEKLLKAKADGRNRYRD
jgi:two-component system cell cycle response regulator